MDFVQVFLMRPHPIPIPPISPSPSTTEDSASTPSTSPDLYDVKISYANNNNNNKNDINDNVHLIVQTNQDGSVLTGSKRPRSLSQTETHLFPTPSSSYFPPESTSTSTKSSLPSPNKMTRRRSNSSEGAGDIQGSDENGSLDLIAERSSCASSSVDGTDDSMESTSSSQRTSPISHADTSLVTFPTIASSDTSKSIILTTSFSSTNTNVENVNMVEDLTPTRSRPISSETTSSTSNSSDRTSLPPPSRPPSSYHPYLSTSTSSRISSSRRFSRHLSNSSVGSTGIGETEGSGETTDNRQVEVVEVKVKDFAFPSEDPRHRGEKIRREVLEKGMEGERDGDWWPSPQGQKNKTGAILNSYDEDDEEDEDDPEFEEFRRWREMEEEEAKKVDVGPGAGGCEVVEDRVYRAAFGFEPEGESEMKLERGDLVKVLELICEGWVVAERIYDDEGQDPENGEVQTADAGLVPANYLELI